MTTSSTARRSGLSRAEHSDLMLLLAAHHAEATTGCRRRGEGLSVFLVDLREALGKG